MRIPGRLIFLLPGAFTGALFSQGAVEPGWLPLTDAERNQKAPTVDKSAGAEALFWRVHVWDEVTGTDWQRHRATYARVKVLMRPGGNK
jgi:hypothetical protein